jgi:exosortase
MEAQTREKQIGISPEKRQWCQLGLHNYIKILITGVLFSYLFHNEIGEIIRGWLTDSSWSHGFLIPMFSLYFINRNKEEIIRGVENGRFKPNYFGLLFLILGILFYPFNIVQLQYGYLRPVGMIATLGAVVLFLGGWRLVKYTWLPIVFLIFAVPLPRRYYVSLTMPMRHLAAVVATALLNLIGGMQATVNGVVIDVIYKGQHLEPSLNVAEACSGMRLLMAFLALGVAMAYLHHRPIWQRVVLVVSTIPIAILCNILRVTTTGFIYVLVHPKYTQGVYHDILGLAMLPLAFGIYGLLAWFMSNLFTEEADVITRNTVTNRNDA